MARSLGAFANINTIVRGNTTRAPLLPAPPGASLRAPSSDEDPRGGRRARTRPFTTHCLGLGLHAGRRVARRHHPARVEAARQAWGAPRIKRDRLREIERHRAKGRQRWTERNGKHRSSMRLLQLQMARTVRAPRNAAGLELDAPRGPAGWVRGGERARHSGRAVKRVRRHGVVREACGGEARAAVRRRGRVCGTRR